VTGSRAPILLAESDPDLGSAIAEQLAADGFSVELAPTSEHARILAKTIAPKLVLLGDLGPPRSSLDLLAEIRDRRRADTPWPEALPAIVMGSRTGQLDVLRAFETGADDFLARSAHYLELRARLRAVLRRAENVGCQRALEVGPLAIDSDARTVSVQGQTVDLRRLEFDLLVHLAREPERVFAKGELLRSVWGYRCCGSSRTVDSHASRLRRKLDVDGSRRWVINVWAVGYRLI
jgi:DNA-binding response OmpR family regulator